LHRSEGFGLTMAEAMLLGKPVIATGYSGNLDFMTADTSLLVDYERVPITLEPSAPGGSGPDLPTYPRGSFWAEPSVDQTAELMRWVYEHPDQARALGHRARRHASRLLSLQAAGRRMQQRLQALEDSERTGCKKRYA
jgi:glycosyltransferase involved in cell wall biosynthesis